MAHSLTWLPDVLEAAGLKVALVDGWENRGPRDVGTIFGVLCHHTVGPRTGNMPIVNGNSNFIGIEAENTGIANDFPWPAVQIDAYQRGVAAILKKIGRGADFCGGHKEYAPHRKTDPDFDMGAFRIAVGAILGGTAPAPVLIPAAEPPAQPGGPVGRPTLRRNSKGDLVRQIQAKLGVEQVGNFGPKTEAAVREFQRNQGLVPDGIVGPKTWAALDSV